MLAAMAETTKTLLAEIEQFLARSGMRPSTFGHNTANDGKLVARLRRGRTVTLETAGRIKAFIQTEITKLDEVASAHKSFPGIGKKKAA